MQNFLAKLILIAGIFMVVSQAHAFPIEGFYPATTDGTTTGGGSRNYSCVSQEYGFVVAVFTNRETGAVTSTLSSYGDGAITIFYPIMAKGLYDVEYWDVDNQGNPMRVAYTLLDVIPSKP